MTCNIMQTVLIKLINNDQKPLMSQKYLLECERKAMTRNCRNQNQIRRPSKPKWETTITTNRHNKENIWLTKRASLSQKLATQLPRVTKLNMSHVVRKPAFCICENKDADQLRGKREADQRLCFRYTDNTIPLLFKYEISSL